MRYKRIRPKYTYDMLLLILLFKMYWFNNVTKPNKRGNRRLF